jgi:molybdenum cofactor biosynthesis enzyme MoaA
MKKIKSVTAYRLNDSEDSIEDGIITSIIRYNEAQQVIEEISYTSDNEFESKVIAKYNEKGSLIEEINYMDEEEIAEKLAFIRNDNDQIQKVLIDYADDSQSKKHIHIIMIIPLTFK